MASHTAASSSFAPSVRLHGDSREDTSRLERQQEAWLYRAFTRALLHSFWSSSNSTLQRTIRCRIKSKNKFREKCEALGQCLVRVGGAAAAAALKPLEHPDLLAAVVHVGTHEFFHRFMFDGVDSDPLYRPPDGDLRRMYPAIQPKHGPWRLFAVPYVSLRDSMNGDATVHICLDNLEKELPESETEWGKSIMQQGDAADEVYRSRYAEENGAVPYSELSLGQLQELVAHGQFFLSAVEQQLRDFWTCASHIKLILQQHARKGVHVSGTGKAGAVLNEAEQAGVAGEWEPNAHVSDVDCSSGVLRSLPSVNKRGLTPEAVLGLRCWNGQTERSGCQDAETGAARSASEGLKARDSHTGPAGDGEVTLSSGNERSFISQTLPTSENLPCSSVRHVQSHSCRHEVSHSSGVPGRQRESAERELPPTSPPFSPQRLRHRPVVSLAELGDLSVLERRSRDQKSQRDRQWHSEAPMSGELVGGDDTGDVSLKLGTEPSVLSVDSSSDTAEKPELKKKSQPADENGPETDEVATEASSDEWAVIAGGKELEEICDAVYSESLRLQELVSFYEDFAAECLQRQGFELGAARFRENEL
ncbi:hypothetical protein TGRUB_289700 [Toxoplasma gondii RUB]|uniref:Uncharacterized protein n=1 Tax=Toxoplasma gondii RUB TaxID=935652 RepID=A0A086M1C9_TOXGO|nr:hypothetical protein TGRUB_289700 [Toxoplasma gondii RUB]